MVLRLSFLALPAVLASWTSWSAGPVVVAGISVLTDLLGASFVALATVALYDDLRVRHDDADLVVRFQLEGVN